MLPVPRDIEATMHLLSPMRGDHPRCREEPLCQAIPLLLPTKNQEFFP